MSVRQASPFGETKVGWAVLKVDEDGLSYVRHPDSWNVMLWDTEEEARVYGRENVFPAYAIKRIEP